MQEIERDRPSITQIDCERATGPRITQAPNLGYLVVAADKTKSAVVITWGRTVAVICAFPNVFLAVATHLILASVLLLMGAGGVSPPPSGGSGGYTGLGDCSGCPSTAVAYWGLRGYTNAFSGAVANICDAATGLVCADATWGSGTLTLPTIGGFTCDNATHQCEIKTLYDQSGSTNCSGACNVTGAHGDRPLLRTSCIGALPCVDSNNTASLASPNLSAGFAQPFSMSIVAVRNNATGGSVLSINGGGSVFVLFNGANQISMLAGATGSATAADSTTHTLQFLFSNASSVLYVDATSNAVTAGASAIISGDPITFPSRALATLTGYVYEGGLWSGDKSSNFAAMHMNQCTYWGTTC